MLHHLRMICHQDKHLLPDAAISVSHLTKTLLTSSGNASQSFVNVEGRHSSSNTYVIIANIVWNLFILSLSFCPCRWAMQ